MKLNKLVVPLSGSIYIKLRPKLPSANTHCQFCQNTFHHRGIEGLPVFCSLRIGTP